MDVRFGVSYKTEDYVIINATLLLEFYQNVTLSENHLWLIDFSVISLLRSVIKPIQVLAPEDLAL